MIEFTLLLLILLSFGIRTSWFQTWAAQQVASYLSDEWGTEVSIDKVDIVFFDRVDIEGVYVEDKIKDTLLYSQLIHVDISDWSIKESFVDIEKAQLTDSYVYIRKYQGDSTFNFQHIVDYFASDKEKDTTSSKFTVGIKTIQLTNINFIYQDQNAEPLAHGMDFSNLDFRRLSGEFSDFGLKGDSIMLNISNLQFQERSGLALAKLSSDVLYSPELISLANLRIGLNRSWLKSDHFELRMPNGSADFADFVHNVNFYANLRDSRVSLADVAFFVPTIWGMDTDIEIKNIDISGPVYGMKLRDLDLRMLDTTVIQGNFMIPEVDHIETAMISERVTLFRTSLDDIEKLNLSPFLDSGKKYIEVPKTYEDAKLITLENGHIDGFLSDFVVDGEVYSGLGNISSDDGIKFKRDDDGLYRYFGASGVKGEHIIVENLALDVISGNPLLGSMSGFLRIDGKGFSSKDMDLNFNGELKKFDLNDYTYEGIKVKSGNFHRNVFNGKIDIVDDNLALVYDGLVDLNDGMYFDFDIRVDSAHLAKLNMKKDSLGLGDRFETAMHVQIHGTSINSMYGKLVVEKLKYADAKVNFSMEQLTLDISRNSDIDTFKLVSQFVDVDLTGKFDLEDIYPVLEHQFSYVIDHLVPPQEVGKTNNKYFDLIIRLKDVNPLLQFYDADLYIAENSQIRSEYNVADKMFALDMNFDKIAYRDAFLQDLKIENHFDSTKANLYYAADYGQLNDSVQVQYLFIETNIKDNVFSTFLGWDGYNGTQPGLFAFESLVDENKNVLSEFSPSFFHLQGEKWEVNSNSRIMWSPDLIQLSKFNISNDDHVISFDGNISENPDDWLRVSVQNFDLSDLNGLLGGEMTLGGTLNVDGKVADLYHNIKFSALSDIQQFYINEEFVGDILVNSSWNQELKSIEMNGYLKREGINTLDFAGHYYTEKEDDNLRVKLIFDHTDISFLNAFEDPDLYTNIEGILNGQLEVMGELTNPIITGKLDVLESRVKVPMFNVFFGAKGQIKFADGEFLVDFMELYDQEGNEAVINMQIYHYDWADWNFDINMDMDNPFMSERFLVMDTKYVEGDYYYGKAYISGFVNIFGYADLVQITVDATTEPGTSLVLPMYGSSDLEENSFIKFDRAPNDLRRETQANGGVINAGISESIERLGMTLDMKFNVNNNAKLKIIFDPVYEDQIVVNKGGGQIEIKMDDYGEMTMFGKYVIDDGVYNMRMKSVIKEDFYLQPNSSITWTQSPYDALIDITASFTRDVSLNNITSEDRGSLKDEVYGDLIMSKTLMAPALNFDIRAPNADEDGKAAISAIKSNPDDLNKQFFALLVLHRFLPTQGNSGGSDGSMMYNLAESQINAVLGNLSENYEMATELDENTIKIGTSKKVGDRVTISTNIGVVSESDAEGGSSASNIVGDVNVEYRLNDDGTFTMNFFNESNQGSNAEQGPFTQGVSLHYQESFNTVKEFRLLQHFLNIFRSDTNKIRFEKRGRGGNWEDIPEGSTLNPGREPVPLDANKVGALRKFIKRQ